MKRIIRPLVSIFLLAAISVGVIGQTVAEDDDFLLSLIPVIMTSLYHRAEPGKASFIDSIEIIAVETPTSKRFDFRLSAYPVGKGIRYVWAFGDGQYADGDSVSHDYATVGVYALRLTIYVPGYPAQTLQKQIQVKPQNQLPEADFSVSTTSGYAPLNVSFDAGLSTDSDGEIVHYTWHFGDGSNASGRTVSHRYQSMGVYTNYAASLTVTDDRGGQATTSQYIRVSQADNIPVARFTMTPPSGGVSRIIRFDARASTDRDGEIVSYAWDFGDGASAQGDRVRHDYAQPGRYTPTLTVTDNSGARHTLQQSLLISSPIPPDAHISVSASSGAWPLDISFDARASQNSDSAGLTYVWDFGDGHVEQGIQVSHRYTRPGDFRASLYVQNDLGVMGVQHQNITVTGSDVVPSEPILQPSPVLTGDNPVSLSGTAGAGTTLKLIVNDVAQTQIVTDSAGRWQADVALLDGLNRVRVEHNGENGVAAATRLIAYENITPRDISGEQIDGVRVLTPGIPPRPYIVDTGDLHVAEGGKLILQAGVEIQFDSGGTQGIRRTALKVDGSLSILGSSEAPVRLTLNPLQDDLQSDYWRGIQISDLAEDVIIDHALIEHTDKALKSEGTAIHLSNSHIRGRGISLDNVSGHSYVLDSVIEGGFTGLYVRGDSRVTLRGNTFVDNTTGVSLVCEVLDAGTRIECPWATINHNNLLSRRAIRISDQMRSTRIRSGVDARWNWWGTTDARIIGQYQVDSQEFLDGPAPGGKVFSGELFDAQGTSFPVDADIRIADGHSYRAYSTIRVPEGVDLTLAPGASLILDDTYSPHFDLDVKGKLQLQAGASIIAMGRNRINIDGGIEVKGTSESPVNFRPAIPGSGWDQWFGIHVKAGASPVNIDHAVIEFAEKGLHFDEAGGVLINSLVQENRHGVYISGCADPLVRGNSINRNTFGLTEAGSEFCPDGPQTQVVKNNLQDNTSSSVGLTQIASTNPVRHMPSNWWGSVDAAQIGLGIYDRIDSGQGPYLDFSGFLGAPFPDGLAYSGGRLELLVIHENLRLDGSEDYVLLGDLYVPEGVTLTLASGMRLNMEDDQGVGRSLIVDGTLSLEAGAVIEFGGRDQRIEINGSLLVSGTADNPVLLASSRTAPQAGDWQGIHITKTAGQVNIDYAEIRHAERGVWFDGADGRVENSLFAFNQIGLLASSAAIPQLGQNSYAGNRFDTQFFSGAVNPESRPPVAGFSASGNVQGQPDRYDFDGSDSKPGYGTDYAIVAYAWDFGDGERATGIQVSHTYSGVGQYTVRLDVLDQNGGFDSLTQTIEVLQANRPPQADAGPDQFKEAGVSVSMDAGSSSDSDGVISTYSWQQRFGPTVSLSNPNSSISSFVMPDIGAEQSLVFELTVTDNLGASASDTLSITQLAPNQPPEAFAGPDRRRDAGDTVTLDASFSRDEDGSIVSYQWAQISGPLVDLGDDASVKASFTMPVLQAGQSLVFELSVTDDRGAVSSDRVSIERRKEVTLVSTVNSGIAPLQVSFIVKTDLSVKVTAYGMDYEGDGTIDKVSTDADGFEFTYTQAGRYAPYVSVLDEQGNYHIDRISIEVVSADDEIALIRTQWLALAQALIAGDVETAMSYVADYKREDYRQLFNALGADKLGEIFGNATEIYLQTLTDNLALCRVVRVESAGRFVYPVRFYKGNDGVWKLLRF